MQAKIKYHFTAQIWRYGAAGGWHFVSLPVEISTEIRQHSGWQEEGWGRMKAIARIGDIEWNTAIWFDKKRNTYLLPVKAEVRKKLGLEVKSVLEVVLAI